MFTIYTIDILVLPLMKQDLIKEQKSDLKINSLDC